VICHIFLIDSIYTRKFVLFFLKNFSPQEHIFWTVNPELYRDISHANVQKLDPKNISEVARFVECAKKSRHVIIHSLFDARLFFWLFFHKSLLKKSTWVIWGADAYYNFDVNYSLKGFKLFVKSRIKRFMKRFVIRNLDSIACLVKGDYDYVKDYYKTRAIYKYVFYPNPVDIDILDSLKQTDLKEGECKRILVGNSAAPTNRHVEILESLKAYGGNFEILCPLSYGDKQYAQSVIDIGKRLFGDRFIPLTDFLDARSYAEVLNSVDVAVFNHMRQEALGNIFALLYLKKKVYIRSETTHWKTLKDLGVTLLDTNLILKGKADLLAPLEEVYAERNREVIRREFSEENCARLWANLFDSVNS
jgi:dTDP-N-acetylfucosamine:lipid II N-acetylfucosaminyltransferase